MSASREDLQAVRHGPFAAACTARPSRQRSAAGPWGRFQARTCGQQAGRPAPPLSCSRRTLPRTAPLLVRRSRCWTARGWGMRRRRSASGLRDCLRCASCPWAGVGRGLPSLCCRRSINRHGRRLPPLLHGHGMQAHGQPLLSHACRPARHGSPAALACPPNAACPAYAVAGVPPKGAVHLAAVAQPHARGERACGGAALASHHGGLVPGGGGRRWGQLAAAFSQPLSMACCPLRGPAWAGDWTAVAASRDAYHPPPPLCFKGPPLPPPPPLCSWQWESPTARPHSCWIPTMSTVRAWLSWAPMWQRPPPPSRCAKGAPAHCGRAAVGRSPVA